ncbi:alpha-amylase family glycosyl hydrolase [Celerinatantimonas yamalensis]|uniref:Alpha-amylase family glycosyl hydrolase n=1 Tax=Celerinatantimonas yamalensis TaxID=559956 RepID=A0ABW9GAX5_9GAMM
MNHAICQLANHQSINQLRIYEIMVESFVDGDPAISYKVGYGPSHHSGDLQGVIDSLGYIKQLGMNAIWLTPIFESKPILGQTLSASKLDATGYYASNYFKIDPRVGTLQKAKELVKKAHQLGLYVFFDGVFGHHKANIEPSPFGLLPDGSADHVRYPQSLKFYQEVINYWTKTLKIDGWRLDQAYQVPPQDWVKLRQSVEQASQSVSYLNAKGQSVHPLGYMVAEVWSSNSHYITQSVYGSDNAPVLCSAFAFPLRYRLVETFAVNENSVGHKGGRWLADGLNLQDNYPEHAHPNLMLGNHDLVRFGDLLQRGLIADPKEPIYWQRHKAALSFLAAYTGPVTLYYGEEIGEQVPNFDVKVPSDICVSMGLCDDHVARSSARIAGVNTKLSRQEKALHRYVQQLFTLRSVHPALYDGTRINLVANQQVFIDYKQKGDDRIIYMVSTNQKAQQVVLSKAQSGSQGKLVDMLTSESFNASAQGLYHIPLSGYGARFLQVTHPSKAGPTVMAHHTVMHLDGPLGSCQRPDKAGGPLSQPLFLVGDFLDSHWQFMPTRQFRYKGNGLYQLVSDELAGDYHFQYASQGWKPQYTAQQLELTIAKPKGFKQGGYGQDTVAILPQNGRYIWSLQFNPDGTAKQIAFALCPMSH